MSSTPKGLPGFLRRSIRTPYDDTNSFRDPSSQSTDRNQKPLPSQNNIDDEHALANFDKEKRGETFTTQNQTSSSNDDADEEDDDPITPVNRKFRLSLSVDDSRPATNIISSSYSPSTTTKSIKINDTSGITTKNDNNIKDPQDATIQEMHNLSGNTAAEKASNTTATENERTLRERRDTASSSASTSSSTSATTPSTTINPVPVSTSMNPTTTSTTNIISREEEQIDELSNTANTATVGENDEYKHTKQQQQQELELEQIQSRPAATTTRNTTTTTATSERKLTYKELEFEKVMKESVINILELRKIAWNGIPFKHRSQAWKILLGYLPTNSSRRIQTLKRKRSEYRDAIAQHYDIDDNTRTNQEQETLRQVLVDVPRTAPDIGLFRNDLVRQSLARLLYIWAMRHPASSYVQGINDLATPLIAVFLSEYYLKEREKKGNAGVEEEDVLDDILEGKMLEDLTVEVVGEVEADCYWCLTNLLAGIQDHYTSDQPGVQRMVMRLEDLVNRMDGGLTEHLRNTGVEFMQFAFKWMNCLLLREFNLKCIIRLWDTYLSEGDGGFETFHVYVCAAFLCQFGNQVQDMEFDQLFAFMQNIPTSTWGDGEIEILLSQAFVLSTLFDGSDAHLVSQRG